MENTVGVRSVDGEYGRKMGKAGAGGNAAAGEGGKKDVRISPQGGAPSNCIKGSPVVRV